MGGIVVASGASRRGYLGGASFGDFFPLLLCWLPVSDSVALGGGSDVCYLGLVWFGLFLLALEGLIDGY